MYMYMYHMYMHRMYVSYVNIICIYHTYISCVYIKICICHMCIYIVIYLRCPHKGQYMCPVTSHFPIKWWIEFDWTWKIISQFHENPGKHPFTAGTQSEFLVHSLLRADSTIHGAGNCENRLWFLGRLKSELAFWRPKNLRLLCPRKFLSVEV